MSGHTGYPYGGNAARVDVLTGNLRLLDGLVRSCTAFRSWGEMLSVMVTGYYPSLYGRTWREMALRDALKRHGLKMHPTQMPTGGM